MKLPVDQFGKSIPVFPATLKTKQGIFVDESTIGFDMLKANFSGTVTLTYDTDAGPVAGTVLNLAEGEVIGIVEAVSVSTSVECKMS